MDTNEFILRSLEKIQLNNEIAELKHELESQKSELEMQKSQYEHLTLKSKEMITGIIKNNQALSQEKLDLVDKVNTLTTKNNYLQQGLNRIPKFVLKIFSKDSVKLLNGEVKR